MAYKFDPKDNVETQWQKWQEYNTPDTFKHIDEETLRNKTIEDLSYVSQMDVKEYTLFQKWCEIQEKYPSVVVNDLWEGEKKVLADDDQKRKI